MNDLTKNVLVFIVIIVVLLAVVRNLSGVSGMNPTEQKYSQFYDALESGQVKVALIDKEKDIVRYGNGDTPQYFTRIADNDYTALVGDL